MEATGALAAPRIGDLEFVPFSVGEDPKAQGRIAVPISAETEALSTVVILEVDPGNRIPLHTHTAEETLVVEQGSGEAIAGERRGDVSVGSIIVAPAFTPHGFENTGDETLRLIGFFGVGMFASYFDAPVAPFDADVFVTPLLAG